MPTKKKRAVKRKNPAAVALGRLGGKATLAKHGKAALRRAAKRGGKVTGKSLRRRYGSDYFSRIRRGEKPSA
jgi:hypothetical protein